MSKLSQLSVLRALGIPTPAFTSVRYESFRLDTYSEEVGQLRFPVVVRSSYVASSENAEIETLGEVATPPVELERHLYAGVELSKERLFEAIDSVFASYPNPAQQVVVVQESLRAECKGVLWAYRDHLWKTEPGRTKHNSDAAPDSMIFLPKFTRADHEWSRIYRLWRPSPAQVPRSQLRALIALSAYAGELLEEFALEAPHGLEIEYGLVKGKAYVLQFKPLTQPQQAEEILSSASHKDILPPQPSVFVSGMIASCRRHLFTYYQNLDATLPSRSFVELLGGMPWINLSALLDVMVHWGLPTGLVTRSVGGVDFYRVRSRPYRMASKPQVFFHLLKEQLGVGSRVKRWVNNTKRSLAEAQAQRRLLWFQDPDIAFTNWLTQLQLIYVEQVALMQALTGAVSVPARLLDRAKVLDKLQGIDSGLQYPEAFEGVASGAVSVYEFQQKFGHRGFFESDIGQPRFGEATVEALAKVLVFPEKKRTIRPRSGWAKLVSRLLDPITSLFANQEGLQDEVMKMFAALRSEITVQTQARFGDAFEFRDYRPEDLAQGFEESWDSKKWESLTYPTPIGWDMDVFLANRLGQRVAIGQLLGPSAAERRGSAIGIVSGKVRGQIWVFQPDALGFAVCPDFSSIILLTSSLDMSWAPYFLRVDGVLSYVGGTLSPAATIMRKFGIPSILRVPADLELHTGDWVEMDGNTGRVVKLSVEPAPSK